MEYRTDQQIYTTIGSIIRTAAPQDWEKIIITTSMEDDNGEILYDYQDELGNERWFAPETSMQYKVYSAFRELRDLMKTSGNSWESARFTLERSGEFHLEFGYKK